MTPEYASVQRLLVKQLDNGKIVIRLGERTYEGLPVAKAA